MPRHSRAHLGRRWTVHAFSQYIWLVPSDLTIWIEMAMDSSIINPTVCGPRIPAKQLLRWIVVVPPQEFVQGAVSYLARQWVGYYSYTAYQTQLQQESNLLYRPYRNHCWIRRVLVARHVSFSWLVYAVSLDSSSWFNDLSKVLSFSIDWNQSVMRHAHESLSMLNEWMTP